MGRTFDDKDVQIDRKHWPFKLANKGGKPMIQVDHRGDTKDFVSSMILPDARTELTSDPRGDLCYGFGQDEGDCRGILGSQGHPRRRHRPCL